MVESRVVPDEEVVDDRRGAPVLDARFRLARLNRWRGFDGVDSIDEIVEGIDHRNAGRPLAPEIRDGVWLRRMTVFCRPERFEDDVEGERGQSAGILDRWRRKIRLKIIIIGES